MKSTIGTGPTRRVKVHTGFTCNEKCQFCYYRALVHEPPMPIGMLLDEVRLARLIGRIDVDFSGGEPSIQPGIEKALALAKELRFRRINFITNGIALAYEPYFKRLVEAGLNEVLFSIHGARPETHDFLVQRPGAFKAITKAMKLARDYGLHVRTNTTINALNYRELPELAELVLKYEPENINFIFMNPWTTSEVNEKRLFARYSDIMPYAIKAMKIIEPHDVYFALRYVPLCLVPEEYRPFVMTFHNRIMDMYEWDNLFSQFSEDLAYEWIKTRKEVDVLSAWQRYIAKFRISMDDVGYDDGRYNIEMARTWHVKPRACESCKLRDVCDGLKREYVDYFGADEVKPVG
ncbi:MAG: radical SAM protein [Vulcanisaeta sp.]|nr:radical SAM protein [Vulcanisaeta sp.]